MNPHAYKTGRLLRTLNEHARAYSGCGSLDGAIDELFSRNDYELEKFLTTSMFENLGAMRAAVLELYRTGTRPTGTDDISEAINSFIDGYVRADE